MYCHANVQPTKVLYMGIDLYNTLPKPYDIISDDELVEDISKYCKGNCDHDKRCRNAEEEGRETPRLKE